MCARSIVLRIVNLCVVYVRICTKAKVSCASLYTEECYKVNGD